MPYFELTPEHELLAQAAAGNEGIFSTLFMRYSPKVKQYTAVVTHGYHYDTNDITQEVFAML